MKKIGFAITILGLLFAIFAFLAFRKEQAFLSRAELVTARVIDLEEKESEDTSDSDETKTLYCAVLGYEAGGQSYKRISDTCANPANKKVGDEVQLYYDTANPENSQEAGFFSQYAGVLFLSACGLPLLLMGMGFAMATNRKPAPAK